MDTSTDRGQVATALMMIVTIAVLTVTVYAILPVGAASDESARSQTAADAAALAAATQIRDNLPAGFFAVLRDRDDLLDPLPFPCGLGRDAAESYAARNQARVTSYCYSAADGHIRVSVENDESQVQPGAPARSSAEAATGFDPTQCTWVEDTPPPPDPDNPPPEPDPDAPPPDTPLELQCGGLTLDYVVDGTTGKLRLQTPLPVILQQLRALMRPRLVR